MENFTEKLKTYFEVTPRKIILEQWEKTREFDNVGPTMDEFLQHINLTSPNGETLKFKSEIKDGKLNIQLEPIEFTTPRKEKTLFPKYNNLNKIGGYYIDSDSGIQYVDDVDSYPNNYNVFTTKEFAEASLAIARISQTYNRYLQWVRDPSKTDGKKRGYFGEEMQVGFLRMHFADPSDWTDFYLSNEDDIELVNKVSSKYIKVQR